MNILKLLNNKQKNKLIIKEYESNHIIFYEGDKCDNVGIVIKGKVEISSTLNNGNKIIYNTINQNEMFGNNLIFTSNNKYKGNIITLENTNIAYINKNDLLDILKNNNEFLIEYLNRQSEFSKKLNEKIKLLSIKNAKDRFLFYLKINNYKINYSTISLLAEELSLQRETLSRVISKLEKDKVIIKKNKSIELRN